MGKRSRIQEGWQEYEWRWNSEIGVLKRDFPQALWQGEDLADKTILVWREQGVGDVILCAGMVPALIAAGVRVILECDPRLVNLFERSFPDVTSIALTDPPAPQLLADNIDYQIAIGSLGRWLRKTTDQQLVPTSYLTADAVKRDELRESYRAGDERLLVGVSWNSVSDNLKSLPLLDLSPLAGVPGVKLIDLQYGDTLVERAAFAADVGTEILHDTRIDQLADLDAFAAQVAAMDLVVTVSNTTAHFAGALGIPTWVLLSTVPLPCWLLDRENSPWYPSVKLFRQSQFGQWADVIERVTSELENLPK